MGFLKKITRPISRALDKIIPNEVKPALPFLAAAAPFMAPGLMGLGGNTMLSRALMSGGLNLGSQLAQEGSDGDFSALSLAMASGIGALSAPGTQPTTMRGDLRVPSSIGPGNAIAGSIDPGIATETIRTTTLPGFGAERVVSAGAPSAGDYLRSLSDSGGIGDKGLEFLAKGSDKLIGLQEGLAADGIFSKAGAKALSIPFTQGTTDLAVAETRRFNKQQIIDDALGALDDAADDAARASAIRLAMQQYGFTEDEITDTISSAGYRAGGRVGLKGGGADFGGIPAAIQNIQEDAEEMITIMTDNGPIQIEKSVYESMPGMFMDTTTSAYGDAGRGRPVPQFADGGRIGFDNGGFEPFKYTSKIPRVFKEDPFGSDPLGQILNMSYTVRAPLIDIIRTVAKTATEATKLAAAAVKLGYDVTEPVREVVGDVAGGIYDIAKKSVQESGDASRLIQPTYYLERFGPEKNLTDDETRLKRLKRSIGRDDRDLIKTIENRIFAYDDAGMNQNEEDKKVSNKIQTKIDERNFGFADGGLMNLGGKEMDMRTGGFIPIGKKERADDVPARLSKNEFVMTADAVRAAGGGSVNKGAKRMYDLMNNLEARV